MVSLSFPEQSPCSTTAQQAWAILRRHARDEISHLRLQELCRDNDRVSSLVSVYNARTPGSNSMLMVDLSRQRMTLETLNHLLRLGTARGLPNFIRQLSWGPNDPEQPILSMRHQNISHRKGRESDSHCSDLPPKKRQTRPVCTIPSYHMALRAPSGKSLEMLAEDGTNVLVNIHNDWDRIRRISESLRRGKLPGVTGGMITDVIVVGKGLAFMALRFAYLALCKDEAATIGRRVGIDGQYQSQHHRKSIGGGIFGHRRMKFLTTVDPVGAAAVVADSDPATTLVITLAMVENEELEETMLATQTLHTWLLTNLVAQGRRADVILNKHTILVTSHEHLTKDHKPEFVFLTPEHSRCGSFTTFTAASLLPLSIVFGWPTVESFLSGAHDIDQHFVETNPRHNLPVLLALTDIWNDCLLSPSSHNNQQSRSCNNVGRIVTPYTEAFVAYPAFVAALEAHTCGRQRKGPNFHPRSGETDKGSESSWMSSVIPSSGLHAPLPTQSVSSMGSCSAVVIDGGLHGIYDRSLHLSTKIIPSELVTTLDSQLVTNGAVLKGGSGEEGSKGAFFEAQDAVICALFAHADGLAFGSDYLNTDHYYNEQDFPVVSRDSKIQDPEAGNRPTSLLLCSRLDAFTCGQLVAVAEHRATIKAWIWEMDPFPLGSKSGREEIPSQRSKHVQVLKETLEKMISSEEDDDDEDVDETEIGLNLSTKTILRHYANMVKGQRRGSLSS